MARRAGVETAQEVIAFPVASTSECQICLKDVRQGAVAGRVDFLHLECILTQSISYKTEKGCLNINHNLSHQLSYMHIDEDEDFLIKICSCGLRSCLLPQSLQSINLSVHCSQTKQLKGHDSHNLLYSLQTLKEQLDQEKQALSFLHSASTTFLEAGQQYCLLPKQWLKAWRSHLDQGHKRDSGIVPPPPLSQAMDSLMCGCHATIQPKLAYTAPQAIRKLVPV